MCLDGVHGMMWPDLSPSLVAPVLPCICSLAAACSGAENAASPQSICISVCASVSSFRGGEMGACIVRRINPYTVQYMYM